MQQTTGFERDLAKAGANVRGRFGRMRFLTRRYPVGAIGLVIMLVLVFMAIFANQIMPHDPIRTFPRNALQPPSWDHWLGTDNLGRDVASRIILGARISITVGLAATALGVFLGVMLGLTSGFLGGKVDLVLQRLSDIIQALPSLILAMTLAAVMGPSLTNTVLAIAITKMPTIARVIRANTLALRAQPFVEAARATGMGELRIAIRHILPNTLAPLIVLASANVGSAILIEASLSFLGLGIPEPAPSWGKMLSQSAADYLRTAPWLVICPGIAISLAVFGSNLLGDAIRDILDPRQAGR